MSQKTHVMHGRDHLPYGADPIPGLFTNSGFTPYRECTLARPELWAYWPMDDTSGDAQEIVRGDTGVRVTDQSTITYGLDGPFDADYPARTAAGFTGGFGPTGAEDRFEHTPGGSDSAIFNANQAFSVESWIYPTSVSGSFPQIVFMNRNPATIGAGGFQVGTDPSDGSLTAVRVSVSVNSTDPLPLNTWTHWRATYDGSTLSLYINGVLNDTAAAAAAATGNGNWAIGNGTDPATSASPWQGRISDVAVYDDAVATFCPTVTTEGPGASAAATGKVLTADGAGGIGWEYPTIEIEYA